MAVQSGTAGSVVVGTATVARVTEWSLSLSREAVEISGMGQGWRDFLPGIAGATGSFSAAEDLADPGQQALLTAALGAGTVGLKLHQGTAFYNIGTAIITGRNPSLSFDGATTTSYDFTVSGPVS